MQKPTLKTSPNPIDPLLKIAVKAKVILGENENKHHVEIDEYDPERGENFLPFWIPKEYIASTKPQLIPRWEEWKILQAEYMEKKQKENEGGKDGGEDKKDGETAQNVSEETKDGRNNAS